MLRDRVSKQSPRESEELEWAAVFLDDEDQSLSGHGLVFHDAVALNALEKDFCSVSAECFGQS